MHQQSIQLKLKWAEQGQANTQKARAAITYQIPEPRGMGHLVTQRCNMIMQARYLGCAGTFRVSANIAKEASSNVFSCDLAPCSDLTCYTRNSCTSVGGGQGPPQEEVSGQTSQSSITHSPETKSPATEQQDDTSYSSTALTMLLGQICCSLAAAAPDCHRFITPCFSSWGKIKKKSLGKKDSW